MTEMQAIWFVAVIASALFVVAAVHLGRQK
jgi:cell division protein FtsL